MRVANMADSKPNPKTVNDVLSHLFVKEYASYLRSTGKARTLCRAGGRQTPRPGACCAPEGSCAARPHAAVAASRCCGRAALRGLDARRASPPGATELVAAKGAYGGRRAG